MDYSKVRTVLLRVLVLNWIVAALKITVGILSGSIAILTDGVHSFFDGLSNIIGLTGIHFARRPRDEKHPYGYTKYEALAALGIGVFILIGGYEVGRGIVGRIFNPSSPTITFVFLGVLGVALLIDILVARYEYHWGKKLKSKILVADARHTATHLLTTSSVIAGSVGIMFGYSFLDVVVASIVWVMVVKLVWLIFQDVRGVLTDSVFLDPSAIQKIAEKFPGVRSSHDIRSRGDHHAAFIDMHIEVDPALSLEEAHRISDKVREKIKSEIGGVSDVVVHFEPAEKKKNKKEKKK